MYGLTKYDTVNFEYLMLLKVYSTINFCNEIILALTEI